VDAKWTSHHALPIRSGPAIAQPLKPRRSERWTFPGRRRSAIVASSANRSGPCAGGLSKAL
jgi:hypothetical protein